MSEKVSYKKIDNHAESNGAKSPKTNGFETKFIWSWVPYERKFILILMIVCWIVVFTEYLLMNQRLANQIQGLTDGMFGFKKDTHDMQWNAYKDNLPLIILAAVFHLIVSHLIRKHLKDPKTNESKSYLIAFNLIFGLGILVYMFQAGLVFWMILITANYLMVKCIGSYAFYEPLLWVCTLLTLYCNETYHGYRFSWFHQSFDFLDKNVHEAPAQWYVMFNLTILRLMSFCLDYSWTMRNKRRPTSSEHEKKCHICNQTTLCYKIRQETHAPLIDYSFYNYLTFLVYCPLFISGPVTTFNAWMSQIHNQQNTFSNKQVWKYVLRTFLDYIAFEIFLHCFYVCALSTMSENAHIWQQFSLRHLGVMSFLELFFLWFKFMLIWRIPRAWALLDGIEVPENMNRCMTNNYTFEGFWRSWHRGFNQWLIRYLFIPLGGSKYKLYNIWVIFSFVGLWHDMNLNLLVWAWGICLALVPEMLIRWYFWLPKNRFLWEKVWWKYVCAFGGAVDIIFMIIANLVGFGIGWQGLMSVLHNFLNLDGFINMSFGLFGFSLLTLVLFMIREKESEIDKGF